MPFIPHTPESLLARSDSKDPATTCNGITSTGRPCRRALATSPRSSPSPRASPSAIGRVLAVAPAERDRRGTVEAAVFFCWQHKEQAERWGADNGSRGDRQKKKIGEMRGRTSVDTLIDRLGLLEVGDGSPKKVEGRHHRVSREKTGLETRKSGLGPSTKALEQGPRVGAAKPAVPPRKTRRKSRDDGSLIVSLFCCVRSVDPEYLPPPRPRPQSQGNQPPRADCPQMEEAPAAARSLTSSLVNTKPEKAAQPVSIERDQGRASHHSTRPATARVPFPKTAPQRINRPRTPRPTPSNSNPNPPLPHPRSPPTAHDLRPPLRTRQTPPRLRRLRLHLHLLADRRRLHTTSLPTNRGLPPPAEPATTTAAPLTRQRPRPRPRTHGPERHDNDNTQDRPRVERAPPAERMVPAVRLCAVARALLPSPPLLCPLTRFLLVTVVGVGSTASAVHAAQSPTRLARRATHSHRAGASAGEEAVCGLWAGASGVV